MIIDEDIIFIRIYREFDYLILIRLHSYRKWILKIFKRTCRYLFLLISAWFIIALLVSIGMPISFKWSELSQIQTINGEITFILSQYLGGPFVAVALQLIIFSFTLLAIQIFLSIIYVLTQRRYLIIGFSVFFFFMSILSFKILPASFSSIGLPNYLSLYHGSYNFNSVIFPVSIVIACLILLYFVVFQVDKNFISLKRRLG